MERNKTLANINTNLGGTKLKPESYRNEILAEIEKNTRTIKPAKPAIWRCLNNQNPSQPATDSYTAVKASNFEPATEDYRKDYSQLGDFIQLTNNNPSKEVKVKITGIAYVTTGGSGFSEHIGFHISNLDTAEKLSGSESYHAFGITFGGVPTVTFSCTGYGVWGSGETMGLRVICDFNGAVVFVDEVMFVVEEL